MPSSVVADADNDGVTDEDDSCPNTHADSDVDSTGCDPVQGVVLLGDLVEDTSLSRDNRNALSAKLAGIEVLLNDAEPANDRAACDPLRAFLNQVAAFKRTVIVLNYDTLLEAAL